MEPLRVKHPYRVSCIRSIQLRCATRSQARGRWTGSATASPQLLADHLLAAVVVGEHDLTSRRLSPVWILRPSRQSSRHPAVRQRRSRPAAGGRPGKRHASPRSSSRQVWRRSVPSLAARGLFICGDGSERGGSSRFERRGRRAHSGPTVPIPGRSESDPVFVVPARLRSSERSIDARSRASRRLESTARPRLAVESESRGFIPMAGDPDDRARLIRSLLSATAT